MSGAPLGVIVPLGGRLAASCQPPLPPLPDIYYCCSIHFRRPAVSGFVGTTPGMLHRDRNIMEKRELAGCGWICRVFVHLTHDAGTLTVSMT